MQGHQVWCDPGPPVFVVVSQRCAKVVPGVPRFPLSGPAHGVHRFRVRRLSDRHHSRAHTRDLQAEHAGKTSQHGPAGAVDVRWSHILPHRRCHVRHCYATEASSVFPPEHDPRLGEQLGAGLGEGAESASEPRDVQHDDVKVRLLVRVRLAGRDRIVRLGGDQHHGARLTRFVAGRDLGDSARPRLAPFRSNITFLRKMADVLVRFFPCTFLY